MKNLKTFLLPALIVMAGGGSAYATHSVKQSKKTIVEGYVKRPGQPIPCEPSSKECDTSGSFICTADVGMGSEDLYELNGTACPDKLRHTEPN